MTLTITPASFSSFGDLLRYLRRRVQLTQRDLGIATGYSEAHVSRPLVRDYVYAALVADPPRRKRLHLLAAE